MAYIRRELGHLYEYGLHKARNAGINGSRLSSRQTGPMLTFYASFWRN